MTTAKDQIRFSKPKKVEKAPPPSWESSSEERLYKAYHSRDNGGMYFSPANMRAFSTTIKDVWYNPVTTDYLFITREVRRSMTQRNAPYYTLRLLSAKGKIRNIGELLSTYSVCAKSLTSITTGKSPLPEPKQ